MPFLAASEALIGLGLGAAAATVISLAPSAGGVPLAVFTAFLLTWVVWRDAMTFMIPDGATVALAIVGCASRFADQGLSVETAVSLLSDVALTGGALWLVREIYFRWRGKDGLGLGDVKLATAAGCLVGADGFAFALLAAATAGLGLALVRRAQLGDRIAFGVLLAPAIWITLAAELAVAGGWT